MLGTAVRFIVSALVLMLIGFLLPGVIVNGFWGALAGAIVITVLGYLMESLFNDKMSPQKRGLIGFISAAIVIYLAQFIIPAYLSVTLLGSLLAAFTIGIIDIVIPTQLR